MPPDPPVPDELARLREAWEDVRCDECHDAQSDALIAALTTHADTLRAALDEQTLRHGRTLERMANALRLSGDERTYEEMEEQLTTLRDALREVRELHRAAFEFAHRLPRERGFCVHCRASWPCPTAKVVTKALGGEG